MWSTEVRLPQLKMSRWGVEVGGGAGNKTKRWGHANRSRQQWGPPAKPRNPRSELCDEPFPTESSLAPAARCRAAPNSQGGFWALGCPSALTRQTQPQPPLEADSRPPSTVTNAPCAALVRQAANPYNPLALLQTLPMSAPTSACVTPRRRLLQTTNREADSGFC